MEKTGIVPIASNSIEDFSDFVDAEESVSAPTELLAEFLHSVMIKDYEKALKYCNQILTYEPDYATVKEFRPIIEEKLEMLRNEESEDDSSTSSLSFSSSTSSSSDNLYTIKNQTDWEPRSYNSSSLDSGNGNKKTPRIRKSGVFQSDIANGNSEIHCSSPSAEDSTRASDTKEINTSETRTLINANFFAHKTRTKILRREGAEYGQNEPVNLKIENPGILLHPTDTRVLTKGNSAPVKDNSRAFAWFSSLQENLFGNRNRENPGSKKSVQNIENTNNAKGKTVRSDKNGTKQTSTKNFGFQ